MICEASKQQPASEFKEINNNSSSNACMHAEIYNHACVGRLIDDPYDVRLSPDDAAERRRRRRRRRRGHRPEVGGAAVVAAGQVRRARHRYQAQPSAPQIRLLLALVADTFLVVLPTSM